MLEAIVGDLVRPGPAAVVVVEVDPKLESEVRGLFAESKVPTSFVDTSLVGGCA